MSISQKEAYLVNKYEKTFNLLIKAMLSEAAITYTLDGKMQELTLPSTVKRMGQQNSITMLGGVSRGSISLKDNFELVKNAFSLSPSNSIPRDTLTHVQQETCARKFIQQHCS